jgi:hypothetical protein
VILPRVVTLCRLAYNRIEKRGEIAGAGEI